MQNHLATRMDGLNGSAIREIFKLLSDPSIISFAGGNPSVKSFPTEEMAALSAQLLRDKGDVLLQYGTTEGYAPLRESLLEVLAERKVDLEAKQKELEGIDQETSKEMEALTAQSQRAAAKIDDRLLAAYKRIRHNVRNGLAVVTVKRDACGGCYNRIPPQRQMDIRMSKKVIVCEYCGRILVSNLLDEEEQQ